MGWARRGCFPVAQEAHLGWSLRPPLMELRCRAPGALALRLAPALSCRLLAPPAGHAEAPSRLRRQQPGPATPPLGRWQRSLLRIVPSLTLPPARSTWPLSCGCLQTWRASLSLRWPAAPPTSSPASQPLRRGTGSTWRWPSGKMQGAQGRRRADLLEVVFALASRSILCPAGAVL